MTVGDSWSCVVNLYGREVCWGLPEVREGKVPPPEQCGVPPPTKCGPYQQIAYAKGPVSASQSCVIRDDDSIQCFGYDPSERTVREVVGGVPRGRFKVVEPGGWNTCAIDVVDELRCWGPPKAAVLGAPADYARGYDGRFRQVSVGNKHMCTVSRGTPIEYVAKGGTCRYDCGELRCWGIDIDGQIRSHPPRLPGSTAGKEIYYYVRRVSCGWDHSCIITDENTLLCWGFNGFGETEAPPDVGWTDVKCGFDHCCAIKADNHSVACWGRTQRGQTDVPPHATLCAPPPPTDAPTAAVIKAETTSKKVRYSIVLEGAAPSLRRAGARPWAARWRAALTAATVLVLCVRLGRA